MKNLLNSIMQDQDLFGDANNDLTSALEALEENRRHDAIDSTLDVLSISSDITQRLAAMYLYHLALTAKKEEIKEALDIAYDTSDRKLHHKLRYDFEEENKKAHADCMESLNKLDSTLIMFNQAIKRLNDKL